MSIAGGFARAVERAVAVGCSALQVFTKNSNQWAARPIAAEEAAAFRGALQHAGIADVVAHDSYLINLCSPNEALWTRSIEACAGELERCALLGIPGLVIHPGGHMGQGEEFGIRRMAEAIDVVHARVPAGEGAASLLIETSAGQGTTIGHRFEHIGRIIALTSDPARVGACLDTCHVFAAGYELRTRAGYEETLRRFDGEIGLERLRAVHVNDSRKDLGCRVDRHAPIGEGFLGREAFRHLMNDSRLVDRLLVLETPKDDEGREDVRNLTLLMSLVVTGRTRKARPERSRGARA